MSAEVLIPAIWITVMGLILGSFANVVIYRLPLGQSVAWPGSRCRSCGKPVRWFDNVPVLAWIWLGGRCRSCKATISWRYPLVEFLTGAIFLAVFLRYGWTITTLELVIFSWSLIVVSFIDFDHMILPDVFTLSGIVIGLLGSWLNPERTVMSALAGVIMGGGFLWTIAYVYYLLRKEEGMGGGDIKLLAWIGAVLGWTSIPFVILASSLIGSVVGLVYAVRSKTGLKSVIPFGPYLALAAILYYLGGEQIGLWYIGLFIPAATPVN